MSWRQSNAWKKPCDIIKYKDEIQVSLERQPNKKKTEWTNATDDSISAFAQRLHANT